MKLPATLALAGLTLSLAACASNRDAGYVESGYHPGSLAVAAIHRGDWETAEKLLVAHRNIAADDPARLINLGKVYWETGRRGEALSLWREAMASERHQMVETIDGRWVNTQELARTALDRYDTEVRTAAR